MPLTNAQHQANARKRRAAKIDRYERALAAIAGGAAMPSQVACDALANTAKS